MAAPPPPAFLRQLESITAAHPLDRKLLVCRSLGEGREMLRSLAVRGRSWVGWEVTTPPRLALDIVGAELAAEGLAPADAFEQEAAIDVALDRALASAAGTVRELGDSPGFREAVAGAVGALRLAGVDPAAARRAGAAGLPGLLAAVLEAYVGELSDSRRVDHAAVLERAAGRLRSGDAAGVDPRRTFLAPGLSLRAGAGRVVRALLDAGVRVVGSDPVVGLPVPPVTWAPSAEPAPLSGLLSDEPAHGGGSLDLDLFAASGPAEELREVLRRVMAAGLRWDEVEIVATDPVVYGGALHALAERLDIPVSYAVGLPVERTRPGRAAATYLRWVQSGFPADLIRGLLESGDLRPPRGGPSSAVLSRRLRQLRVGWGHGRYLAALDRRLRALRADPRPRPDESSDDAAERVAREREQLESLRALLEPVLKTTPPVDPHDRGQTVSPAALAAGLRSFLDLVPPSDAASATARDRLSVIADRIAATLTRPTTPAAAVAVLQRHMQIRVPAPQREGSSPWTSAGGHLHLTDIDHGGLTARPAVFVVGLDAERFPGAGLQDPLLPDARRRALDPEALPTSADRLDAARFRLAALLARLRGRVTLSYSAWDPAEAREVAPSTVLLQAFRLRDGDAAASFDDLRRALGDAASAIPRGDPLDAADLWFAALDQGGILLDGVEAVRTAYPELDRGLGARAALGGAAASRHHGAIEPRPDRLDPRRNPDIILSASGLEDLGTCARRWFYRYALRVREPDDPELDPDRWLTPMDRGRLLHGVYERTLRESREGDVEPGGVAFTELALRALDAEAERIAADVPPPGAAVRAREMVALREDVRSFARMVADGVDWEALELRFGLGDRAPAPLRLAGGTVRMRGAIDRIDRVADELRVVDYKTGSPDRFARNGVFHGGRRLQNAVYAAVAESLLGRRVRSMAYHFPTRGGRNEVVEFSREEVRRGLGLIDRLLDAVAAGRFLPTDDPADCRFCDYQPICRHSSEGWQSVTPLADWGREGFATLPEYQELREARSWEESFLAELGDDG